MCVVSRAQGKAIQCIHHRDHTKVRASYSLKHRDLCMWVWVCVCFVNRTQAKQFDHRGRTRVQASSLLKHRDPICVCMFVSLL